VQQAEFNHTVLHGQRLSFDLANPNPSPIGRPLVVPKANNLHPPPPPPASARPSSVASKEAAVKVYGGPSAIKRPSSATPGGAANRFIKH
jgi:hypothetical protein